MKKQAITLLSGGLDSTVATMLALKKYRVSLAITFDYGQKAAGKEISTAAYLCKTQKIRHKIIKLPWLAEITKTALVNSGKSVPKTSSKNVDKNACNRAALVWVPNRNGVFIAIAASFAESEKVGTIIAGFNREEARTFPDNSVNFIKNTNSSLDLSTLNHVKLVSPTANMTKEDIARKFVSLKVPPRALWCCYNGGKKLCGKCESCVRTIRAFAKIDKQDYIRDCHLPI